MFDIRSRLDRSYFSIKPNYRRNTNILCSLEPRWAHAPHQSSLEPLRAHAPHQRHSSACLGSELKKVLDSLIWICQSDTAQLPFKMKTYDCCDHDLLLAQHLLRSIHSLGQALQFATNFSLIPTFLSHRSPVRCQIPVQSGSSYSQGALDL